MIVYNLHFPKLSYGWQQEMVLQPDKYSFSLPPGKVLITTPQINVSDSAFWALGVTHRNYNDGGQAFDHELSRRAVCAGRSYVGAGFIGGSDADKEARTISTMSDAECLNVGTQLIAGGRGYSVFVEQAGEIVPGQAQGNWGMDHTVAQYLKIRKACAAAIRSIGGEDHGGYDGHLYLGSVIAGNGVAWMRTHLASPTTMLSLVKDPSQNFSSGPNGVYFQDEHYLWRGGIIQLYWATGMDDVKKWVFSKLMAFHLDYFAKQAGNISSQTIGFSFQTGSDFVGYTSIYKRTMAGGYMQGSHQPKVPPGAMAFAQYIPFVMAKGNFLWHTTDVFGQDPAIVQPNEGLVQYVGSGSPTRSTPRNGEAPQNGTAPYPSHPVGFDDIGIASARQYGKGWEHANSTAWKYVAIKRGGSYATLNQYTYPLDQYEAGNASYAIALGDDNNRQVCYFGKGGIQTLLIEGQELVIDAPDYFPVWKNIQL